MFLSVEPVVFHLFMIHDYRNLFMINLLFIISVGFRSALP